MQRDLALLVLRVAAAGMMLPHGFAKVQKIVAGNMRFPDPLGIGDAPSLILAAFAEFVCAIAVLVGFKTRWSSIPLAVTMLVAAFVHHGGDAWDKKELPLLYAAAFIALALLDGGRYAVDAFLKKRRKG